MALTTTTPINPDSRYNAEQTAALLGVAVGTLANWRIKGKGPVFVRITKRSPSYYWGSDLIKWLKEQRVKSQDVA